MAKRIDSNIAKMAKTFQVTFVSVGSSRHLVHWGYIVNQLAWIGKRLNAIFCATLRFVFHFTHLLLIFYWASVSRSLVILMCAVCLQCPHESIALFFPFEIFNFIRSNMARIARRIWSRWVVGQFITLFASSFFFHTIWLRTNRTSHIFLSTKDVMWLFYSRA